MGDKLYITHNIKLKKKQIDLGRLFLHASLLGFEDIDNSYQEFKSDLPKKLKTGQTNADQTEAFRYILELMKKKEMVLEINTGGIDRGYHREPYPSRQILQHAAELGIEMTLGSDAHAPQQVGRYFNQAVDLLKAYGWKHVVAFKNRKKEYISLYE